MQKRPVTYLAVYWLGKVLASSPLVLRILLGQLIFILWLIIPDGHKKNAAQNLRLFFPQLSSAGRMGFIAANLYNSVHTMLDIVAMWWRGSSWAYQRIKRVHNEYLLRANDERGVLFVAPHLGNWELLGSFLTRSHKCLAMYKNSPNPYYDKLSTKYRQACGISTIAVKDTMAMRQIIRALKPGGGNNNNALILLPDQHPRTKHGYEMIEFYTAKIPTNSLAYKLIQATDCRVVFVYSVRRAWGYYEVFLTEPHRDIYNKDMSKSLTAMNKSCEECINNAPTHYNWLYDKHKGAVKL